MQEKIKLNLRQSLKNLNPGEVLTFPMSRAAVIRATTQELKNSYGLKFKTRKDKENLKINKI